MDTSEFDAVMAGLDYPMFVVTTRHGGDRAGCMVGFTTQASIDPPRMLVCLSTKNHTYRVARDARLLAVHVLQPDDGPLAELFGAETGDEVDKFARTGWTEGPEGVPLLEECPRRFVGRIIRTVGLGDHAGFLLEPVQVEASGDGPGMGFRQVADLEPGHDA